MFYPIAWWASAIFVSLFGIWLFFNVWVNLTFLRFMSSLPWMTWMTLEDALKHSGVRKFFCTMFLAQLNDDGYLETRVIDGLEHFEKRMAHTYGLKSYNVDHFEFRLVPKRGRPKRLRFRLSSLAGIPADARKNPA